MTGNIWSHHSRFVWFYTTNLLVTNNPVNPDTRLYGPIGSEFMDSVLWLAYSSVGRCRTREIDPRKPGKISVSLTFRVGTDFLLVVRDMLSSRPILAMLDTSDDPPKLINGNCVPVNGT